MDVKFIKPLQGAYKPRLHQFTAINDWLRLQVLRICDFDNQKTAIQFLEYVFQKLPFRIETLQTENGSEFGTQFHRHVLDSGIRHVCIKPATPRSNGKVERSHRIDALGGQTPYEPLRSKTQPTETLLERIPAICTIPTLRNRGHIKR